MQQEWLVCSMAIEVISIEISVAAVKQRTRFTHIAKYLGVVILCDGTTNEISARREIYNSWENCARTACLTATGS